MSPETAAGGALLWGRAAVLATFALLTGALAHVQADGPRGSGERRGSFYDVAYSAPTPDAPGAEGLSLPEPRPVLPVLGRSLSRRGPPRPPVSAVLTAA